MSATADLKNISFRIGTVAEGKLAKSENLAHPDAHIEKSRTVGLDIGRTETEFCVRILALRITIGTVTAILGGNRVKTQLNRACFETRPFGGCFADRPQPEHIDIKPAQLPEIIAKDDDARDVH
jgi:hypothetical protein